MKKKRKKKRHEVVALDPGSRTFMTAYSPTEGQGKLTINGLDRTKILLERIDQIKSTMMKIKSKEDSNRSYGKNAIKNRI